MKKIPWLFGVFALSVSHAFAQDPLAEFDSDRRVQLLDSPPTNFVQQAAFTDVSDTDNRRSIVQVRGESFQDDFRSQQRGLPAGDDLAVPTFEDVRVLPASATTATQTVAASLEPGCTTLGCNTGVACNNCNDGSCPSCSAFQSLHSGDGVFHSFGADRWIRLGAGLRTSYSAIENGAPNNGAGTGTSWANDFRMDNMRIFLSGQAYRGIGFELNTDINGAQGFEEFDYISGFGGFEQSGGVRVVDAVVKFQLTDELNLWAGRFLAPSDRTNLAGQFFMNAWSAPYVQFGYQNIFQGRDDGAALWGQHLGGVVKWYFGVFEGRDGLAGPTLNSPPPRTDKDSPYVVGRFALHLLDSEPGYYNKNTYYGEKEVFTLGWGFAHQRNATGSNALSDGRDFFAWNFDALYETKLDSGGVWTFEAAFYDFDDNDAQAVDPAGRFTPLGRQGESFLIQTSYLMPGQANIGPMCGRFQPFIRYQDYNRDFTGAGPFAFDEGLDLGVHFIIDGHNARLSAVWEQRELNTAAGAGDISILRVGAQLQF
ncbi:MAG: hypothetical protein O3A00_12260 [Planctomycetota bacterium]|nr:hypothetical protein [Planctomycetota bacterium]